MKEIKGKRKQSLKIIEGKTLPPVVAVVGYSGAGKTTYLEKLISTLTQRGLNVGTIKHDVHGFEMDKPGKDTWRHKKAGARTTLISSPFQIGMVRDVDHDHGLDELATLLTGMDFILAEGFKRSSVPKLEIYRPEAYKDPICLNDRNLLALISDAPLDLGVPRYRLGDIDGVAEFLISRFKVAPKAPEIQQEAAL
ncbi:MAG: molybdopterin-guanine dinucleotide biosynthesis protein B [Desulfobacterales bacterium]|nr:molybdopterin-guanine dinucleotide biosynthesis protein B [Desulfobacterales bacterium]